MENDKLDIAWRSRALVIIGAIVANASSQIVERLVAEIKPDAMRDLKSIWELIIHCVHEGAAPNRQMLLVIAQREGLNGTEALLDQAVKQWFESGISLEELPAVIGDMIDLAYRLYLADVGRSIINRVQNLTYAPGEIMSDVFKRFQSLAALTADPQPLDAILDELSVYTNESKFIPTGFAQLDQVLNGGLGRGKLCVIGGRPGMMKTSWALELAARVATKGYKVLFFSLEMTKDEIVRWLIRSWAGLPATPWTLDCKDSKVNGVLPLLRAMGSKLLIDDAVPRSSDEIVAVASAYQPDLVIIDYVELLSDVGEDVSGHMRDVIVRTYRKLRVMAKNTGCVMVVLSQFNRQVEMLSNHVPQLSHFMWGGEADADVALGMYYPARLVRAGLSLAWPPFVEKDGNGYPRLDRVYVLVLKNRSGTPAVIPFGVTKEGLRIDDLERPATF